MWLWGVLDVEGGQLAGERLYRGHGWRQVQLESRDRVCIRICAGSMSDNYIFLDIMVAMSIVEQVSYLQDRNELEILY